jgi:predicted nucleotidyltransferase component of viral defense system
MMADLEELVLAAEKDGYTGVNAEAKVCQDIVLKAISQSRLKENVTVKGGVVMRSITDSSRRIIRNGEEYRLSFMLLDF